MRNHKKLGTTTAALAALRAVTISVAGLTLSFGAEAALIHHYTFDSGTVAIDSVGGATGTLFGGASITGGALSLDGVDDYVETLGLHIIPTAGDFTISMLAQQRAFGGAWVELISQQKLGGGSFYLGYDPSHKFRVSDAHLSTSIPFPADGALHAYALSYLSGVASLYIDGIFIANFTGLAIGTGGSDTRFGRQYGGFGEFFNGTLDDIRVYNTALSAGEIGALADGDTETGVPAPASLALLGLGLIAFAARRRKTA